MKDLSRHPADFLKNLPSSPGVYMMKDSSGKVLYVGKAANLKKRLAFYFSSGGNSPRLPGRTRALLARTFYVDYIVSVSEREALILEDRLIKKLRPFYNILLRDDKTYPYLKLSLSEKFPSVSVARLLPRYKSAKPSRDLYFGPYPETPGLRGFAFWLNKSFGLKLCRKIPDKVEERKRCLYRQTGECGCDCVFYYDKNPDDKYKLGVRSAKKFLTGGKALERLERRLIADLEEHSGKLEFEKAAAIRDILYTLKKISCPIRGVREVDEKVYTALSDTTEKLKTIQSELSLKRFPMVIECADISNTAGEYAVGSVVRFVAAEPDKSGYRRFRIKGGGIFSAGETPRQNDFAMIEEVVYRRLSRLYKGMEKDSACRLPDLFVVDGGLGQLSAADKAVERAGVKGKVDMIAISKGGDRDEIYFTDNDGGIKRVSVSDGDSALLIISHIRDEAHRFAVSYHKKLRDKSFVRPTQTSRN